jgi:hypothetical protein
MEQRVGVVIWLSVMYSPLEDVCRDVGLVAAASMRQNCQRLEAQSPRGISPSTVFCDRRIDLGET